MWSLHARGRDAPAPTASRCADAAWDSSHYSADQDWVPMVNGQAVDGSTLWRWVAPDGSSAGHLQNQRTGGHINFRPGGFVRGHGNENTKPRRPATQSASTMLERAEVDLGHAAEAYPCAMAPVYSFKFRTRGGGHVHVLQDGALSAIKSTCSDDAACLFSMVAAPGHPGWHVVRSVLSGGLLRMVDDVHPRFDGWDGYYRPKAAMKRAGRLRRQAARAAAIRSSGALPSGAAATCPLRPKARAAAPRGWSYNASDYAPLISASLAPWYDGGVTATAMDLGYAHEMYPYANRHERPSLHVSLAPDGMHYKWQRSAQRRGDPPATPAASVT